MPGTRSAAAQACKAACSRSASGASLTTPAVNVTGGAIVAADGTGTLNGSLNYTSSTSSTFIGAITGPSSTVTMNNALAMLTLSGSSNYGGGTTIQAGTLQLGSNAALGAGTGSLVVNLGGLLDLNGFSAGVGALNGGGTIDNVAGVGASTLTFGNGGANGTFSGTIQNSSPTGTVALVKTGAGAQILSGVNAYSGGTTLSAGTLAITNASSLGLSSGGLSIGPATLEVSGVVASTRNIALTAPSSTISVDLLQSYSNSGTISGNGGLTVSGQGLLVLSGSNNYSGGTHVTAGTLQLGNNNALGTGGLTANSGVVDLAGNNPTFPSLSGINGTITNSTGSSLLTVNQTTATTFSGVLQDSAGGTVGLSFNGGRLLLSGVNGYSGGTTLSGGTLAINSAASLGLSSGSLSIGPATLEVSGAVADSRNIALTAPSATISVDASQSYNNSGTISGNGGLTVSGQGLLGLYGANSYSGTTTVSAGTLELGNANALQNSALLDNAAGVLAFATSGLTYNAAGLAGSSNIALLGVSGGSLTLNVGSNNASTTYAGNLSGPVALVKVGGGMFSLTGANAMTGGVTVSGGTLQLAGQSGGTGTLPNNTYITVNNNAALLVNGADVLGYNPGTNILLNDGLVNVTSGNRGSFNVISMTGGTISSGTGLGDGSGNWLLNGLISATSDAAGNPALINAQEFALNSQNGVR